MFVEPRGTWGGRTFIRFECRACRCAWLNYRPDFVRIVAPAQYIAWMRRWMPDDFSPLN